MMELQGRWMSLTAIYTSQLAFHILDVLVDSRLSLVHSGEPLLPVALMPTAMIDSLVFLPLLGLIAVFKRHQFPPCCIRTLPLSSRPRNLHCLLTCLHPETPPRVALRNYHG